MRGRIYNLLKNLIIESSDNSNKKNIVKLFKKR